MHLTRIGKKAYGAVVGSRAVVIRGIVSNSLAKGISVRTIRDGTTGIDDGYK